MEIDVTESEGAELPPPAVSIEISPEIAEKAEEFLSEFAEDAGLETALIVDRGGALVAGISSEEDVTVDVISGLVAGASSAMRALVDQLGDTGEIESLHQGGERLLYLREIVTRFILVGVSHASFPPGIVREKASQLQPKLADLLRDVKPLDPPEPKSTDKPKSLRAVAAERAAARVKVETVQKGSSPESPFEADNADREEPNEDLEPAGDPDDLDQDGSGEKGEDQDPVKLEDAGEEEKQIQEPVEVLEPIDLGEPEIVIEDSTMDLDGVDESPFELEDDGEVAEEAKETENTAVEPEESVFELEDEVEESEAAVEPSVFEWVDEDEDEGTEEGVPTSEEGKETTETVFEFDADEEDEDEGEDNGDDEDKEKKEMEENGADSSPEDSEENAGEEAESHNSGPLYF